MVEKPTITPALAYSGNMAMDRIGGAPSHHIAPEAFVLHIADGTFAGIASWFKDPTAHVSAHFSVARDGRIQQHVALADTAFANGIIELGASADLITENGGINPNLWTVSCEHEGHTGDTVPAAQFDASTRLCAWVFQTVLLLGGASGVAVDRRHILRHADISPVSRAHCPGWNETFIGQYIARVSELLTVPAPAPQPPDPTRQLIDALTVHGHAWRTLAAESAVRADDIDRLIAEVS